MASPAREILGDRNYRRFWMSQTLQAGVTGPLRFTFVWLVVTLTDWTAAEGLVAAALGLPAMLFSLAAGAWSDRTDRKRLYMFWTTLMIASLAIFTAVIAAGWATPLWTGVAAVVIGTCVTMNPPNVQAMVPTLVPGERLVNAIALQNGAGQATNFLAVVVAGVAIELLGDAGGFALLTVFALLSLNLMRTVTIPADANPGPAQGEGLWRSMRDGLHYAATTEPVRTLLLAALVLGSSFAVMQITMPRVVEDVYERDAASAGLVLGVFGLGMLISSAVIANRNQANHGRNIAIFIGVGLGMGQFLLSFASNLWAAVAIMAGWGVNAGIAMASHRTLLQHQTAPDKMGRVMGLMMTGFMGGLPVGAAIASGLSRFHEPVHTMRVVGVGTMAITIPLLWRRSIRTLD